jgi:hypothetical protein
MPDPARPPGRWGLLSRWAAVAFAAAVSAGLAGARPAHASAGQTTMFDDNRLLVYSDESTRAGTLDQLAALGVDQVRAIVYWRAIANLPNAHTPPSGTRYPEAKLGPYDCLVRDAAARGLGIHLTVSGPIPRWASRSGNSYINDPRPGLYHDLLQKLGERYSGSHLGASCGTPLPKVTSWGLYNEPNVDYFLGPQYRSGHLYVAKLYRRLYLAGHRGLVDSGHGGDRILIGETSPRGTSRAISPLRFLRGSLCLTRNYQLRAGCHKLPTSGWAEHPYSFSQAPWQQGNPGDFNFGSLGRLVSALNKAGRAGAVRSRLPVYITEYGIQSKPDPYSGVSLATQAEWLAVSEFLAFGNPRIHSYAQYLMRDDPPDSTSVKYGGFQTGLRFSNGDRKPAYDEFRIPLVVKRRGSGRVRLWGHVRPYDPSGAPAESKEVRIRVKDGSGKSHFLKAPDLSSRGYFSTSAAFRAGRRWKVVWTSPGGPTFAGPWTRAYRF